MKASIIHALTTYEADLAAETRRAVERVCQPENIQAVVDRAVGDALNAVVHDEVDRFFRSGPGREAVRDAVVERLERLT